MQDSEATPGGQLTRTSILMPISGKAELSAGNFSLSPDGGGQPAWSPDGAELYYIRSDNSIVGISYTVEQCSFRPGKEEVLFQSTLLARKMWTSLAVLGRRTFVVPLLEAEPEPPHLNVVLNWNREVAARLAAR